MVKIELNVQDDGDFYIDWASSHLNFESSFYEDTKIETFYGWSDDDNYVKIYEFAAEGPMEKYAARDWLAAAIAQFRTSGNKYYIIPVWYNLIEQVKQHVFDKEGNYYNFMSGNYDGTDIWMEIMPYDTNIARI